MSNTSTDQDKLTPRTAAASRVWFITGASRGLGRAFTEAALAAGDRVGSMVYELAFDISQRRMDTWAGWERVSRAAENAVPAPGTEAT